MRNKNRRRPGPSVVLLQAFEHWRAIFHQSGPPRSRPGKTNLDARWRLSSLADAWKMRAMSAVRLCVARVTPLVALAALSLIGGCTKPTPLYCEADEDCAPNRGYMAGYSCATNIRPCKLANVPVDANDSGTTGDAPADGGTGEDHPSGTDGPRGDASDGSVDVFHGCVDNRGCPDSTKHVCQVDAGV